MDCKKRTPTRRMLSVWSLLAFVATAFAATTAIASREEIVGFRQVVCEVACPKDPHSVNCSSNVFKFGDCVSTPYPHVYAYVLGCVGPTQEEAKKMSFIVDEHNVDEASPRSINDDESHAHFPPHPIPPHITLRYVHNANPGNGSETCLEGNQSSLVKEAVDVCFSFGSEVLTEGERLLSYKSLVNPATSAHHSAPMFPIAMMKSKPSAIVFGRPTPQNGGARARHHYESIAKARVMKEMGWAVVSEKRGDSSGNGDEEGKNSVFTDIKTGGTLVFAMNFCEAESQQFV